MAKYILYTFSWVAKLDMTHLKSINIQGTNKDQHKILHIQTDRI